MSRSSSATAVYTTAAVVSAVVGVAAGAAIGLSVVGVAGLVVFGSLAVVAARRARTLDGGGGASSHWWQVLLVGVAGLGALGTAGALSEEELSEPLWALYMGGLLVSIGLVVAGGVMGISWHASRKAATPG